MSLLPRVYLKWAELLSALRRIQSAKMDLRGSDMRPSGYIYPCSSRLPLRLWLLENGWEIGGGWFRTIPGQLLNKFLMDDELGKGRGTRVHLNSLSPLYSMATETFVWSVTVMSSSMSSSWRTMNKHLLTLDGAMAGRSNNFNQT